ncbi:hypothetical protein BU16DRAFT_555036 [Lophium mytilinum]|uniref:Uncharacterized protein n=1 Tax=Lophium mytilinum TaxID=390894 RepID=A0A6A6RHS0_9PEZI|nr:hypothetical protein BU16DRAFT_555036 [Lophium mytilinum]
MAPHRSNNRPASTNRYSPYKAPTIPLRSLVTNYFTSRNSPGSSSQIAPKVSTKMAREQDIIAAAPNKLQSVLMEKRPPEMGKSRLPPELWLEVGDFLGVIPLSHKHNPHAFSKRDKTLDANSDVCGMESPIIKNLKEAHKPRISGDIDMLLALFHSKSTFAAYVNNRTNIRLILAWFNDIGDAQDPAGTNYGVNCIRDIVFWTNIRVTPLRDYDSYVRIRVMLDRKRSLFKVTTNASRYQEEQMGKKLGRVLKALTQYLDACVRKRLIGSFYLDLSDWQAILKILVQKARQ